MKDFPLAQIRRFFEPGPIILVSSTHRDFEPMSGRNADYHKHFRPETL